MKTMTLPSRMRGVSMIGWLLIGTVVVVFGSAGMKTIPAYLEFNTVKGAIVSVLQDSKAALKSESELRGELDKRFVINNVKAISVTDVGFSKEVSGVIAVVDYEVRENLFGNLDLVMTFSGEFTKDGRR
tara:strand:+ start:62 stop:448 length:387 start_codon:yes stop_codon:yes gene_type:complete